jgi:hypothetical protein
MKELKQWQYDRLKKHIQDNQYYLGEKGRIVNQHDAEIDFLNHHLQKVAHDLRLEFCNNICPYSETCEIAKMFRDNG